MIVQALHTYRQTMGTCSVVCGIGLCRILYRSPYISWWMVHSGDSYFGNRSHYKNNESSTPNSRLTVYRVKFAHTSICQTRAQNR